MAVIDDLNRLAQDAVVYLTQQFGSSREGHGNGSLVVYRGRLRQALSGDWVFNTSVGTNGVEAIILSTASGTWDSNETPSGGVVVNATFTLVAGAIGPILVAVQGGQPSALFDGGTGQALQISPLLEMITLSDVIPADLSD